MDVYLLRTYLMTPVRPAQFHAARAAARVSQQPRGWQQCAEQGGDKRGRGQTLT